MQLPLELNHAPHYIAERYGVQVFHKWLMKNEKCDSFTQGDWGLIFRALEFAEKIHKKEARKISQDAYITHPLEIVQKYIEDEDVVDCESIMSLILHDTIESDHGCWQDLLREFGIKIFLRVLKLSKPTPKLREEISKTLLSMMSQLDCEYQDLARAMNMLHIYDDSMDTKSFSHLTPEEHREVYENIHTYERHLNIYFPNMSEEKKETEILACWNYAFFDEHDARHKYYDTLHNLSDVAHMQDENEKIKYIARRIPKVNALVMALKRNGLQKYIEKLASVWRGIGGIVSESGHFHIHMLNWRYGEVEDFADLL